VLALGAANLVGAVLFAAVYAAGGTRRLSQAGFLVCLALVFALVTAVWARTESRHAPLGLVRRVGRAAGGLALVVVGAPIAVLMPLFWLETVLPPEADLSRVLAPAMALTLIALALVGLANVAGAVVQGVRELRRPTSGWRSIARRPGRRPPP
jgi:hypothetical protein